MKKVTSLLALLTAAMLTLATSAMASDLKVLKIGGNYSHIESLVNGVATTEGGGSIDTSYLDGRPLDYLYCVDLFTNVYVPADYSNTTVNNNALIHGNPVTNAGGIAYLLGKYGVGGEGDQAIALQAAIWHEINGTGVYDLNTKAYGESSDIATKYNTYITEAGKYSGDISKFTWINPGNGSGNAYQGLVTNSPNPEPSTYALMCIGGVFVMFRLWKSRKASALSA